MFVEEIDIYVQLWRTVGLCIGVEDSIGWIWLLVRIGSGYGCGGRPQ